MKTPTHKQILNEINELHSLSHQVTCSTNQVQESMKSIQNLQKNMSALNDVHEEYKRKEAELAEQIQELRNRVR